MKKKIWLYLYCCIPSYLLSQEYTISGTCLNHDKNPIEFIKISLYQDDTLLVAGTHTDSLGAFLLTARQGIYTLLFEKINTQYWKNTVELIQNIDLGRLEIDETKILQEITVTQEKPLWIRKPDRLVFNVENSLVASNGTLLDALKATPGVHVGTTSISVIGKGTTFILVDERPLNFSGESLLHYLTGISAENIQSIEVMTNPPAKYDAQGSSGIINIRYKKGRKNYWNSNTFLGRCQGTYGRTILTENFNYNKNKLSFDVSFNGTTGYQKRIANSDTYYPNETWIEKGRNKAGMDNYSERLNIAYQLSELSSIGAIVELQQFRPPKNQSTYNSSIAQGDKLVNRMQTLQTEANKSDMIATNLNYDLKFGKDDNLAINLDAFNHENNRISAFNSNRTDLNGVSVLQTIGENHSLLNIENYSAKIDMQHFGGLIAYGGKTSSTTTKSKVKFFDKIYGNLIEDSTKTNQFLYREEINALYFNATVGSEKIQAQIGIRYEHTKTKSHSAQKDSTNTRNYSDFFPSAFLMYMLNENDFLNASYSRRIERPQFWEMDPFRMQLSAYSYIEGNPFLQPSISDNLELTYGWNDLIYLSGGIAKSSNQFTQFTNLDSLTKIQATVRDNFITLINYNMSLYSYFNVLKWLKTQVQGELSYYKPSIEKQAYKNTFYLHSGWNGSIQIDNILTPFAKNNSPNIGIVYRYELPSKIVMYDMKAIHNVDFVIRFYFLNNDLRCQLYIEDVFNTALPNITQNANGMRQHLQYSPETRVVWIGVSYAIGNSTIREIDKEFSNQDEQNRSKRQ